MTMEERLSLLEQNAAAQVPTPTEYYTSRWSGEEIDKGISGALQLGGATTPQAALRYIGGRPNRNLLDNWYFVGGGSQQGGGQFPINQRGETSYAVNGYGIDRWRANSSDMTVAVTAGGITVSLSAGEGDRMIFEQVLPFMLSGQMCTLTILTADGELYSGSAVFPASGYTSVFTIPNIGDARLNNRSMTGDQSVYLIINRGASIQIAAAKLELGDHQTLAYQDEEGNWHLFETPDYGEELAKCQRYLLVLPGFDTMYSNIGVGSFFSETEAEITIPTPASMRIIPTCTATGIWMLRGGGQTINADANTSNFLAQQMASNSVSMIIGELSGCPVNQAVQLLRGNNNTAKIIFSAEL